MEQEQSPQQETERKTFSNLKPGELAEMSEIFESIFPDPGPPIAVIDGEIISAQYMVGRHFAFSEEEKVLLERRTGKTAEKPEPVDISNYRGVKYNSKQEVINHLKGITPESEVIPDLRKQLKSAEQRADIAEQRAEEVAARLSKVEQDEVAIKERLDKIDKQKAHIEDRVSSLEGE